MLSKSGAACDSRTLVPERAMIEKTHAFAMACSGSWRELCPRWANLITFSNKMRSKGGYANPDFDVVKIWTQEPSTRISGKRSFPSSTFGSTGYSCGRAAWITLFESLRKTSEIILRKWGNCPVRRYIHCSHFGVKWGLPLPEQTVPKVLPVKEICPKSAVLDRIERVGNSDWHIAHARINILSGSAWDWSVWWWVDPEKDIECLPPLSEEIYWPTSVSIWSSRVGRVDLGLLADGFTFFISELLMLLSRQVAGETYVTNLFFPRTRLKVHRRLWCRHQSQFSLVFEASHWIYSDQRIHKRISYMHWCYTLRWDGASGWWKSMLLIRWASIDTPFFYNTHRKRACLWPSRHSLLNTSMNCRKTCKYSLPRYEPNTSRQVIDMVGRQTLAKRSKDGTGVLSIYSRAGGSATVEWLLRQVPANYPLFLAEMKCASSCLGLL